MHSPNMTGSGIRSDSLVVSVSALLESIPGLGQIFRLPVTEFGAVRITSYFACG